MFSRGSSAYSVGEIQRLIVHGRVSQTAIKRLGPKLAPFLMAVCVYCWTWSPSSSPSWLRATVKILPVLSLGVFVWADGRSVGHHSSYSLKVLLGLLCSAVGDVLMVWGDHGFFLHAMAVFVVAHLSYTSAFGLRPLRPGLGLAFLTLAAGGWVWLYPCLPGSYPYSIGGYTLALSFMAWRATARAWGSGLPPPRWPRAWGVAGAAFFLASDLILAASRFCYPSSPGSHSAAVVMSTYYAAQLLIALSVVGQSGGRDTLWKRTH